MTDGWDTSAEAWIADMSGGGDYSRRAVLDRPMMARVDAAAPRRVLDVGCGEGRFCRMMAAPGREITGLDPTLRLLEEARGQDPDAPPARYIEGRAEALPFADSAFDLVVSYLSLIDIPDARAGLAEMARVVAPGGHLLIANLTPLATASQIKDGGWRRDAEGVPTMAITRYLEEHSHQASWRGISIRNWHRPLAVYMQALLSEGLRLTHFDEPASHDPDPKRAARYNGAPYFLIMEWQK